jgi:hypothetical protein
MRTLLITSALLVIAGIPAGYARGGMHGSSLGSLMGNSPSLMAPANPSVPPSLTPDPRLTGTAPLPPHHQPTQADVAALKGVSRAPDVEDAKVDRIVRSICRGC